jgi:hypothetical protein
MTGGDLPMFANAHRRSREPLAAPPHGIRGSRGREPYKYRFGARDRCDRTSLLPRGPAGALLTTRHRVWDRVHRARTEDERAHEG